MLFAHVHSALKDLSCKCFDLLLGEMWFSITLAIVVEVVPSNVRTSAVAVYLFVIHNSPFGEI